MSTTTDIHLFFNFRSPYCYLVSKSMWSIFDDYHVNMLWRPLGGWDGRSPPERAKVKVPLVRQDIARWTKKLGIPLVPPPITTNPTIAALGSLLAEEKGLLRPYVTEVMRAEWAYGKDIGEAAVLLDVGESIGLDRAALNDAIHSEEYANKLVAHNQEAEAMGVIGVPTFVVGKEVFWGNDRQDFVHDHLKDLRLAKV